MQIRKLTSILATAAVVSGAGIGVAQAQSGPSTKTARTAPGGKRGGMSATQIKALADKLGVTTVKLRAALAATRPARPAAGERPAKGAGMAADLASALGVEAAEVQEILDANRPARPAAGTAPAKPDHTKLIAALASGLGLDEATVKAAFDKLEAAHQARHAERDAAMAAALAKELGLSARKSS